MILEARIVSLQNHFLYILIEDRLKIMMKLHIQKIEDAEQV